MDLGLDGQTITNQVFDYAMSMSTDAGFKLRIENDYALYTGTASWNVSPESSHADSERVPSLKARTISSATTDHSGGLEISFTDGHRLTVGPNADYEAWSLAAPAGARSSACPAVNSPPGPQNPGDHHSPMISTVRSS